MSSVITVLTDARTAAELIFGGRCVVSLEKRSFLIVFGWIHSVTICGWLWWKVIGKSEATIVEALKE